MDRKLISIAIIFIIALALSSCSSYQQKVQKATSTPSDGQQQEAKPNLLVPEEPTGEQDNGAGVEHYYVWYRAILYFSMEEIGFQR